MILSKEQKMIRDAMRSISDGVLKPNATDVDRQGAFPKEGIEKLAETGFMGIAVPSAFGGTGADTVSYALAVEEIARGCASTALLFVSHAAIAKAVAVAGSDEQRKTYLPDMISGDRLGALAMTEPISGSDLLATSTKAVGNGSNFVINGQKTFITGAGRADNYIIVLRTDKSQAPHHLSSIMVEKGTPGFSFGTVEDNLGLRGASNGELIFEDCRVPRKNLFGPENGFMEFSPPFLSLGLIGAAAMSVGIAQSAYEAAVEHAKSRQIGGRPIGSNQGVQFLIAEMSTRLEAARSLVLSAAMQMDGPAPNPLPLFMCKLHASEMAIDVTSKALQVHGGNGYSREFPVERYWRDARGLTLSFHPTEVLKAHLGSMILGFGPH